MESTGEKFFLDWQEAFEAGVPQVGGKGWNLGRLDRYGFPIPLGGVLTTRAYGDFLAANGLRQFITEFAATMSLENIEAEDTRQQLEALRARITTGVIPTRVREELASRLESLGLLRQSLAVRSSATAEDSDQASFAGVHESYLNVNGLDAVCTAIKACYASLWTPRAVSYRRKMKIGAGEVLPAVVIMAMVDARVAGLAFSCDPRTGRRDLITIAAARGLGQALVNGAITPEEITVQYANFGLQVAAWSNTGPRVLSEAQALELARLAQRVQWALGEGQDPQDLEWAHDGRRFWLLQARPVTGLPHPTFPEVAHLPVIWSNGNFKDVVPGVPTTRSWSAIDVFLKHSMFVACEAAGCQLPLGMEVTRRFHGRAYFDLTAQQWAFYDTMGVSPADFNRSLGGHQPEIPLPRPRPLEALRRGWRRLHFLIALWRNDQSMSQYIGRVEAEARRFSESDLTTFSNGRLLEWLGPTIRLSAEFGRSYVLVGSSAALRLLWLGQAARRLYGEEEGSRVASGLMAGHGQVTSAEHGYQVYDLARAAMGEAAAREYLAAHPLDPQGWRQLPAGSSFRTALESFLKAYGHRAVYEGELANPRWREDPGFILEQVRLLLENGLVAEPRRAAQIIRTEAEGRLHQVSWPARQLLNWLADKARVASALRESGKSALVMLIVPFRGVLLEIGRRLVAAGRLEEIADVFHLAVIDIEAFLRCEWDGRGAAELAADRREQRERWLEGEPPDDVIICSSNGQPGELPLTWTSIAAPKKPEAHTRVDGLALHGTSASGGLASGVARVIRHPREGARLQAGEILVAPSTDPGWTPLFLRAAAVVMEVGGYLSHGAIVAREYGLPAVVNIPGLLSQVRDGQRLTVDGDRGRVICEGSRKNGLA
ncbi:MAG: PEP/pyruvate-binding domain-containing protein [Thermodesulfobacteriota bacterium]